MNIVIIEDEPIAAERLFTAIKKIEEHVVLISQPDSIKLSVDFFKNTTEKIDLIFCDIQLSDGLSFEIFKKIEITAPIIFTTAFNEYALKAFKLASVDYLLKPIKHEDLQSALLKFKNYFDKADATLKMDMLQDVLVKVKQKRIVVRYGNMIKAIEIDDAAYFYTKQKVTYVSMKNGEVLPIDDNLDELEKILDPKQFFRINRQCILCFEAIDTMSSYSKSRVKILLKPKSEEEFIVSTDRSSIFKTWLLGI